MTAALLFDLDGTLIDSDAIHREIFAGLLHTRGHRVDERFYLDQIHGQLNADIFARLCPGEDAQSLSDEKEAAFRARLTGLVPAMAGLETLLALAAAKTWRTAVVTNAPRLNAEAMLRAIGHSESFGTLVIGEECVRGKPAPDPYLAALELLGAHPETALAFEDSPSGVASAAAAGVFTIGVRSSLDDAALRSAGASASIADFSDPALSPLLARLEPAR